MSLGEVLAWLIAIDVVLNLAIVIIRYLSWRATLDILQVIRGEKPARVRGHALVGKHTLRADTTESGRMGHDAGETT